MAAVSGGQPRHGACLISSRWIVRVACLSICLSPTVVGEWEIKLEVEKLLFLYRGNVSHKTIGTDPPKF